MGTVDTAIEGVNEHTQIHKSHQNTVYIGYRNFFHHLSEE